MSSASWVCAALTVVSAYVSFGYAIVDQRAASTAEVRVASAYAQARSIALALVATSALFSDSQGFVAAIALLMVMVQLLDGGIGARTGDRARTVGPLVIGLANLTALLWMLSS
ncbi:MAG: hypothetical protein NTV23_09425 [Propionibacteriales bacterium]|nr:hypothetical protein [Propionibacteriales bacterium]